MLMVRGSGPPGYSQLRQNLEPAWAASRSRLQRQERVPVRGLRR